MQKELNKYDITDFINPNDNLLSICYNLYFIEKKINDDINYEIIFFNNVDLFKTKFSSKDKFLAFDKFELLSEGNPYTLVFREDNNYSIVAFSLDEKPKNKNNVIYYEMVDGILKRNECYSNLAQKMNSNIRNREKLNILKNEIENNFERTCVSQVLRINNETHWYNKKFKIGDIVSTFIYEPHFQNFKGIIVSSFFNYANKEYGYVLNNTNIHDSIQSIDVAESNLTLIMDVNHIKKEKALIKLNEQIKDIKNYFDFNDFNNLELN